MKHFSIFNTSAEYNAERPFLIRPQVALVKENDGIDFLGEYDENDTIYYKASAKLTETTSNSTKGLHTNAFNVSITSHTFANGIGVLKFAGEVTSIGECAFYKCSELTSVTIPNSVTSIGNSAFYNCSGLTSVTIPNSVTSIGNSAFYNCSGLTSVTISNSVTNIENYAFLGCSGLTKVTLNSNAIASKSYSLSYTLGSIFGNQVNEYVLGDDVTSIGSYAFYTCSGLTSIKIPNSVTSIGNYAFRNCSELTSVICNATIAPTINSSTFQNVKSGGTLIVPTGSTGYDVWMGTGNYYLGKYNWTKVEQ